MKESEFLISGKEYWYTNLQLGRSRQSVRQNQKPIKITVNVESSRIYMTSANGCSVYHMNQYGWVNLSLENINPSTYYKNFLFETQDEAKEKYNMLVDDSIETVDMELYNINEKYNKFMTSLENKKYKK